MCFKNLEWTRRDKSSIDDLNNRSELPEASVTLLRDHPLMSYRGVHSWPPTWTWVAGPAKRYAHGEVGILKSVTLSKALPADSCFMYVDYEGSSYIGCLLVDDPTFCQQMVNVFRTYCNCPIIEIGSLDLSFVD